MNKPTHFTLHVTEEHIQRVHDAQNLLYNVNNAPVSDTCPIAQALHDNGYPKASVNVYYWQPVPNGYEYVLPADARDFVNLFDLDKPVEPATFTFRKPKLPS